MGNCFRTDHHYQPIQAVCLEDFTIKYPIGRGGYGQVFKVEHKETGQIFAMKEMRKNLVVAKKSVPAVMNERYLLGFLNHPFIVNLHYAFQTRQSLYLVVDLMSGGDLRHYFVINNRVRSEEALRFLAACIVAGLEYLHSNGIVHRDIKPENLVFDCNGYLHITDFGIARNSNEDNSYISSGTPGYMAPEVLCSQDHGTVADFFALGAILFECITNFRPYKGKNRKEIRDAVLARQARLDKEELSQWSPECLDFINRLIMRKPENRLGINGIEEVKGHCWFQGWDWMKFGCKAFESPFKPKKEDNFDLYQVSKRWEVSYERVNNLNSQKLFAGYLFDATLFRKDTPDTRSVE